MLQEPRRSHLAEHLEALYATVDAPARLQGDPVGFAHRYADPRDAEIAGLVAASLAYGRVAAFQPVVEEILALAAPSPFAFAARFDPDRDGGALRPLVYRWNRGVDFVLLFATLREAIARHGGLEPLFTGDGAREALTRGIDALRRIALEVAASCGVDASTFADLPRGFRYLLPSPAGGSACKRWNMFLRWMVRPPDEGIDLGLWTTLSPADLVMPMDTHTTRISRLIGLTRRTDGSWRTAAEVTANLARLDPLDPVRFDFSMAHLGISDGCRGVRDDAVCPSCPLQPVCVPGRSA